jgi:arginine N-succinyltransferase
MILLREAREADVETLEGLADIPGFISLPHDPDAIRAKILKSADCFSGKVKNKGEAKYVFVAEDLASKRVVGTSQISGQHGTPDSPHFYFQVSNERKFSETINTGFIHGTLELKWDTDGPSEIGGLVVDPRIRNSDDRVGRQISFVRFLYMSVFPDRFKSKVIAELLPPLNKKGQSPLWEAIGRRFTNMDYWEADELCQKSKEFIDSLFPSGKIYTTFFSAEARNAIGKVNKTPGLTECLTM